MRCSTKAEDLGAALRMKNLEDENRRLKQLVAEKLWDIQALKFIASAVL